MAFAITIRARMDNNMRTCALEMIASAASASTFVANFLPPDFEGD